MKVSSAALITLVLFLPAMSWAADIQTAGKMLLLGVGARSEGMGGCGALLGEAAGGLLNPAAQTITGDLAGSIYSSPRPYFTRGYDFLVITASARTEFGYIGASYMLRHGVEGSDRPPEEGSALLIAGRPWRNLAVGLGLKILTAQKANFLPINETGSKTYKMAFDLGALYSGLLPQTTLGRIGNQDDNLRTRFARPIKRGLTLSLTVQNLGGRVEFQNAIDIEMLPQTFRADLHWLSFENQWCTIVAVGELQKLLVRRNLNGGYETATTAFFGAWGGGDREGGWSSRLGFEFNAFGLMSARIGWSVDHGENRSFNHVGLGLGPEWLRANLAWVHEPGGAFGWQNGLRLDASAHLSYEQIRGWMALQD